METTEQIRIKKRTKVNEYTGVSQIVTENGKLYFGASLSSETLPTLFKTEREAAKFIDVLLIKRGQPPVNILRKI